MLSSVSTTNRTLHRFMFHQFIHLLLSTLLTVFLFSIAPVQAVPTCRTTIAHTVCILSIKRSAKNYWEYRASVKVDDTVFPVEVYDCRDRTKTTRKGQLLPFDPDGAGTVICQLLYH